MGILNPLSPLGNVASAKHEAYATFATNDNTTYAVIGKWSEFSRVELTFSSTNKAPYDMLLGRTPTRGYFTYFASGYPAAGNVASPSPRVTAPTFEEMSDGSKHTAALSYTNGNDAPDGLTVGTYDNQIYNKPKKIYRVACYGLDGALACDARPRVLEDGTAKFYDVVTGADLLNYGTFLGGYDDN